MTQSVVLIDDSLTIYIDDGADFGIHPAGIIDDVTINWASLATVAQTAYDAKIVELEEI